MVKRCPNRQVTSGQSWTLTDQNAGFWEDVEVWADGEWTDVEGEVAVDPSAFNELMIVEVDDVACQAEFAASRVDAEAEAELAADRAIANAFSGFLCDV